MQIWNSILGGFPVLCLVVYFFAVNDGIYNIYMIELIRYIWIEWAQQTLFNNSCYILTTQREKIHEMKKYNFERNALE